MATINLGRIKLVNKGTWSNSTAYAIDDFVQYTDNGVVSTYIAVAASTNQTPSTSGTENSNFWKYLAKGVAVAVGNNKVVTSDASGNLQGTSIGSAGQFLRTNSSANGFEFASVSQKVKQILTGSATGVTQASRSTSGDSTFSGNMGNKHVTVNITPTSSSSKIILMGTAPFGVGGNGLGSCGLYYGTGSSSVCVAAVNANGYSADASGASLSGWFTAGTTSQIETSFRAIGEWTGNSVALGSRRGGGTGSSVVPYGNLVVMEVE